MRSDAGNAISFQLDDIDVRYETVAAMLRNRRTPQSLANRLSWLLFALLAWSQLSFAVHQFDHRAVDAGETCEICLQSERNGDAPVGAADVSVSPAKTILVPGESQVAFHAYYFSGYASRASP